MESCISEVLTILIKDLKSITLGKIFLHDQGDHLRLFTLKNLLVVKKQGGGSINSKEVTIF